MKPEALLNRLERFMGEGYFSKLMAVMLALVLLLLALEPVLSHLTN